jgi:4-amino-4-deoxy-L-arabinose transferase-like glycosyltransferase
MFVSGDWVTPRLNGIKFFDKPPLQYWATASAYTLFGPSEWTARIWSALVGLLGALAAWWAARSLYDTRMASPQRWCSSALPSGFSARI